MLVRLPRLPCTGSLTPTAAGQPICACRSTNPGSLTRKFFATRLCCPHYRHGRCDNYGRFAQGIHLNLSPVLKQLRQYGEAQEEFAQADGSSQGERAVGGARHKLPQGRHCRRTIADVSSRKTLCRRSSLASFATTRSRLASSWTRK